LLDAEGHVDKLKSSISIMNTNNKALEQCSSFLSSVGVESHLAKRKPSIKDKQDSYRLYISVRFKSLPHLSVKAGLSPQGLAG